jgi:hypothetical protein
VKSTLLSFLAVSVVVYAGLCLYLYLMQRSLIYFPAPAPDRVPAERVTVDSGDATIVVWRLHAGERDAILYFGGNAEDVTLNIPEFTNWFRDTTVYLVSYRGYGGSGGRPTEQALYGDAEAVFDLAREQHSSVSVVGRSLGSGIATHLASVRPVGKLVLVSPAASFTALAREFYPFFPTSLLLKDRYDSLSRAKRISAPVLILIAENDQIVPPDHSLALAAAIDRSLVKTRTIEGTGHNTIGTSPDYGSALVAFIRDSQPR